MNTKPGPLRLIESILLLLPLRLALGGMFVFAAWTKLSTPQLFANSIKAFKIIDLESGDQVVELLTFALPWSEGICGVLLILGLFTRPAAALISAQLLVFTGAIISVLYRGLDVSCGCFGKYDFPCTGDSLSMCHVWRDVILLIPALILTLRGGGVLALDWPRERRSLARRRPGRDPELD